MAEARHLGNANGLGKLPILNVTSKENLGPNLLGERATEEEMAMSLQVIVAE